MWSKRFFLSVLFVLTVGAAAAQEPPKPDLVVVDVKVTPEHPYAGDVVRFQAVIKNQGNAPTPEGTVVGGVFKVNGVMAAYEDTYKHNIAPGETVTLTSNGGGGAGDGTWKPKPGTYALGFLVDDVNRISESDKKNNTLDKPEALTVAADSSADFVVTRLTWSPKVFRPGDRVTFRATVANVGSAASDAPLAVRFALDGKPVASGRSRTGLAVGRSVEITASAPAPIPAGTHPITATVNPDRQILERRSDNNARTISLGAGVSFRETARPADAFADSIGVCTHLSYYDTSYGRYDEIKQRLIAAGIRHIRDGATPSQTDVIGKFQDLAKSGIHCTVLMDARSVPPAQAVALTQSLLPAIEAVEGPNEPNLFYADLFPDRIRAYQQGLYDALKADPQTKNVTVLSSAVAFANEIAGKLGPEACDAGAMHTYPGGQLPDRSLDADIAASRVVAPNKPMVITEDGFTTASHSNNGQPGVSDAVDGKYIPRLLLETFNRGIVRTYLYEFYDEHNDAGRTDAEQNFGIVHADGTPKPSYTAISRLIHRLGEPGASFTPGRLAYTLTGDLTDLHRTLLQKKDGTFDLILWVNARSFDQDSKTDIAVPAQAVTLRLQRPAKSVRLFRPVQSEGPIQTFTKTGVLTLDVPDEPLVIEIAP